MMSEKILLLLRSFGFRLALVYVGLFSVSALILFGYIYTFGSNYVEEQMNAAIQLRYDDLMNEYKENGSSGIEVRIRELIASDEDGTEIYMLTNREGERLAGNLEAWPQRGEELGEYKNQAVWLQFSIEGTRQYPGPIEVKALSVPISKWRMLLIGQSTQSKKNVEQTILQTLWASLIVTVIMAFIGALVISRSVVKRINEINRSADAIMQGDLSARIRLTGREDEFDALSHNLNHMLDKIQTLMQSLSQFSSNIAHDLRSPLTRIITRTDAGLRGMKEASAARRLLERNVHDMQDLVATFNAILRISELEANADFRDFLPCNLSEILENLAEFYEPLAAEKHIVLAKQIAPNLIIEGEKHLLNQAFANLLDNAIKFTPEHGRVEITASTEGNSTTVTVADTGPGVPEEFRARVFEKFFRLESSRNTKGNGLGLSMVEAVARIHNARILLSDNGPGLRVTLQIDI